MLKYNNYVSFLTSNGYNQVSSFDIFTTTKKISYTCKFGHTTTMSQTSFANKKCKKLPSDLCTECHTTVKVDSSFESKKDLIFKTNGHILLTLNKKEVTYKCGNCGQNRHSFYSSLKNAAKYCNSCISTTTKKKLDDVIDSFEKLKLEHDILHDYKVLEYQNNKNVTFQCDNNHRIDYILGYEGVAIQELLETYNEKDIITNIWCIPTFTYKRVSSDLRPLLKESTLSVYYPDILLPDKIIEVKSKYLYKRDKLNVVEKMKSVARSGYKCELWVYISAKKLWFKKLYELVNGEVEVKKLE